MQCPLKTIKMNDKSWFLCFLFTFILTTTGYSQIIWEESFNIPEKGVWSVVDGYLITDLVEVDWSIDYLGCEFANENDYAKTVTTGNNRFEVLDSDGEVIWYSPKMLVSAYDVIRCSFVGTETGSSTYVDKKYIKAAVVVDSREIQFEPYSVGGNWGTHSFVLDGLSGDSLQLVVRMNSSYSNDKVYIDDIVIEAFDSTVFTPAYIAVVLSPNFAFTNDSVVVSAGIYNSNNDLLKDSTLILACQSDFLEMEPFSFKNGIYSWKGKGDEEGKLRYKISSKNFNANSVDSSIVIYNRSDVDLFEDFEDGIQSGWIMNDQWGISNEEAISDLFSLKHIGLEGEKVSSLSYDDLDLRLSEKNYFFSFKIKNGKWNPSTSNFFYIELLDGENGYWLGVNADGGSDLFSVWQVVDGGAARLIAESDFEWGESTLAQIDITRSAIGVWKVSIFDIGTGKTSLVEFNNIGLIGLSKLALVFNYTSTRAGGLWFDDVIIVGENALPFIASAAPINSNQIQVNFNEAVKVDNLKLSQMLLEGFSGKSYEIESYEIINQNSVILTTVLLVEQTYVITIYDIVDLEGMITETSFFEFENSLNAVENDIVFTEIMADPNPVVALPEAEFVELYNRSDKNIQLNNYKLLVRNSSIVIPEMLMIPGEYIIICDREYEEYFSSYGSVLAVDKFPSLLNAGVNLTLISSQDRAIDSLMYSDSWYRNPDKDNGGYSLERIDVDRNCGQSGNWSVSESVLGGTPGKRNSISGVNVDDLSPVLLAVDIVSKNKIAVIFSEPMDREMAITQHFYEILGLTISEITYNAGALDVEILLSTEIEINKDYLLHTTSLADECGNVMVESEISFSLVELEEGDVLINEVLFNPFTNGSDFVELYNNTSHTIDLADLKLATRDDSFKLKSIYDVSGIHFPFEAGALLVFTRDSQNIVETYMNVANENVFQMAKFPSFNNDKGRVVVLNDSLTILDEFAYKESMHSMWLTSYDGISLERLEFEKATNDYTNWQSASSLVGFATPTIKNTQNEVEEGVEVKVELASDVVSPNGDGYNDKLILSFHLDKTGYLANVYVFDVLGRKIKRLTNNDLIGNMNEIEFDLRDDQGNLLPMGTYLIYTELIHVEQRTQVFKKAFLVTDKK